MSDGSFVWIRGSELINDRMVRRQCKGPRRDEAATERSLPGKVSEVHGEVSEYFTGSLKAKP